MRLAIHHRKGSFSDRWIFYCEENNIEFKIVNAYQNDIIQQLKDCDFFIWHHSHSHQKDLLFAKQLLLSIEGMGVDVFPNYKTTWHFDDKLSQKYLLEGIDAPLVQTHIFYSKDTAYNWLKTTTFPKVFKLRGGAGAANVKLARTRKEASILIKKAFGKGFRQYRPYSNLKERWRQYRLGLTDFKDIIKGVIRIFHEPEFSKTIGYERGYIYFQDFVPNNNSDTRVIVIGNRAFAVKRMVRENDFRASGSGNKKYERKEIDVRTVKIAFDIAKKLKTQSIGFDFVFDVENKPLIVEIGYAFAIEFYDPCPGYWDAELNWHEGYFNPQAWIIDDLLNNNKNLEH